MTVGNLHIFQQQKKASGAQRLIYVVGFIEVLAVIQATLSHGHQALTWMFLW